MKTINQVTNHLLSIIPEIKTIQQDYDYLRMAYRNHNNVKTIESDDEYWTIDFNDGCAQIKWHDLDSYEIEYMSDDCNESHVNGLMQAEIRLYDKYQRDIVNMLESYGYEAYTELEDYMEYYNVFDENVSHRIIISSQIELDEEPSYIFDSQWAKWEIEKEERRKKLLKFVDKEYNLSSYE